MKELKEFLKEKTGRDIWCIFGYELNKFIDYAYLDHEEELMRTATYIYD